MLDKVREFSDNAWEELHDAEKYAHLAKHWKECDSSISEHYLDLAKQEISHYHIISEMATRKIDASNDDKAKYVWKWMQENLSDRLFEVNAKIAICK